MLDIVEIPTKALFLERTRCLKRTPMPATASTTKKTTWYFLLVDDDIDRAVAAAVLSTTHGLFLGPSMTSNGAIALGQYVALHQIASFPSLHGDPSCMVAFASGYSRSLGHVTSLNTPQWLDRLYFNIELKIDGDSLWSLDTGKNHNRSTTLCRAESEGATMHR
ncbi:hypothetical protein SPRG_16507 [Saprolegnia parasitica CBS 223.65]|uniref:Uncharacterized protein n=1 Tax=Saprolegnia parasitica (strain CBS 223.65) TaxID=695850 RepID=A0A067BU07_SAPPC|nr:hypothetical protein SPRG_16507 [Saprolegnia parasitica CBS 223.65]KDO18112.1 hypothetical protein SPRG_16507 [Saprolegnia parasitica CBS 223.65]|eukprot:XP_012211183.1 hypothetical protein SPRG_16507 [Saprolegnia parasitica CBS 223.65]